MEFLKNVFGENALSFEEFKAAVENDKNIKLANLTEGKFVDKEKLERKIAELEEAQTTITKLKESSADVEQLKQTIADYEQKEQKRSEDEAAAKELEEIKSRFSSLKGENAFLNEGTERWIFDEFKNAITLEENKGKSDVDIYASITKDKNIYENPNKLITTPTGNIGGGTAYKSKEDILSIKDRSTRTKAILENPQYFPELQKK